MVEEALKKAAMSYKQHTDKKQRSQTPFYVGQYVYVSTKYLKLKFPCKKLGLKYIGPFVVIKIINPIMVHLKLP